MLHRIVRRTLFAVLLALVPTSAVTLHAQTVESRSATPDAAPATDGADSNTSGAKYTTESIAGQVVWMADALERRFGIKTDADGRESIAALETPAGDLYPIVKDFRGRGFLLDPQLRDRDLELVVRRFPGSPMIQIVRVYSLKEGKKYELDYWCDICAIPMYELKACECCQGPTRIRERLVDDPSVEASAQQ
jgi:hypothetical protein